MSSPGSVTAQDFIENQSQLESEARDALPYDPNHCTYHDDLERQMLFACLTCMKKNSNTMNGICYSCSIQCHSDHELVELFTKRSFSCDCGTQRMASFGGCNIRKNFSSLDIPADSNRYSHNFAGKFCVCESADDGLEGDTMYQCLLGDTCNEDWYHSRCILDIPKQSEQEVQLDKNVSENRPKMLAKLEASDADVTNNQHSGTVNGNETENTTVALKEEIENGNEYGSLLSAADPSIEHPSEVKSESSAHAVLPDEDDFDAFICWKCVKKNPLLLKVDGTDISKSVKRGSTDDTSLFLLPGFRDRISQINGLKPILDKFGFLLVEEVTYEPDNDDDANSSLLDAGTRALNQMPREQALEGLAAYSVFKDKLTHFLKPFADQGKVVTRDDVTEFFENLERKRKRQHQES